MNYHRVIELNAFLDEAIEFGSGGIARLQRKAQGLLKKQQRKLKETDRLGWNQRLQRLSPRKGKDIVYGAKKTRARVAAKHGADRAEALARRKGRMIERPSRRPSEEQKARAKKSKAFFKKYPEYHMVSRAHL